MMALYWWERLAPVVLPQKFSDKTRAFCSGRERRTRPYRQSAGGRSLRHTWKHAEVSGRVQKESPRPVNASFGDCSVPTYPISCC